MALNQLGLGFVFTARDLASGKVQDLARSFSGLDAAALRANQSYQRNLAVMGAGLALMGAGAATLAGAYSLGSEAGRFEQEVQRIGAIAESSSEEVAMLRDAAIEVGLSTKFSPDEAVAGFQALASSGFTAAQSLELIGTTMGFAAAGAVTVDEAARSISAAINTFGLTGTRAQAVGDQFTRIANMTNLTGRDMQIAMANVQRGVQLTHQSIEQTLPVIGLIVDAGADASVAGTGVSSALQFMANNASQIKETLGVDVVETLADGTQRFRSFGEIALQAGDALQAIENPAERAATATELFGRFGVSAVTAVYGRLTGRGVTDAAGNVMHGAEALEYMADEMRNAAGATQEFNDRLLTTLGGQQELLASSTNTLGLVVGEAFAPVMKPIVEGVLEFVRAFARAVESMPEVMKTMIGRFIIVGGVVTLVGGAFLALGAAIVILGPFFAAAASAAFSLFLAMLPIVAVIGSIIGALALFGQAVSLNVGGIGDRFRNLWADVSLVFSAMGQIFSQGYLSGAVAEEFAGASTGVQHFIETLHSLWTRGREFFDGISMGIESMAGALGPTLDGLGASFDRILTALGFMGDAVDGAATTPLERFATVGAQVGVVIGTIFTWFLDLGRVIMDVVGGAIEGMHEGFDASGASMSALSEALGTVWDKLVHLGETLGLVNETTGEGASGWSTFGEIVGGVIGFLAGGIIDFAETIVTVFGWIVSAIQFVINIFKTVSMVGQFVGLVIRTVFLGVRDAILLVLDGMIAGIGRALMAIPEAIRPDWAQGIVEAGGNATRRIETRGNEASNRLDEVGHMLTMSGDEMYGPTAAQSEVRARDSDIQAEAIAGAIARTQDRRQAHRTANTTILQLDGREVGRALSETMSTEAEESFTPSTNMSMASGV